MVNISLNTLLIFVSDESSGSALVHFEQSTLPEHEGTQTFVLRIAKILEPITPRPGSSFDLAAAVVEGSLLPTYTSSGEMKPWSLTDSDSHNAAQTRVLIALPVAPPGEFS